MNTNSDQKTAKEISCEKKVRGYNVKVEYTVVPEDVAQAKWNIILKAVVDSIHKRKK